MIFFINILENTIILQTVKCINRSQAKLRRHSQANIGALLHIILYSTHYNLNGLFLSKCLTDLKQQKYWNIGVFMRLKLLDGL